VAYPVEEKLVIDNAIEVSSDIADLLDEVQE